MQAPGVMTSQRAGWLAWAQSTALNPWSSHPEAAKSMDTDGRLRQILTASEGKIKNVSGDWLRGEMGRSYDVPRD